MTVFVHSIPVTNHLLKGFPTAAASAWRCDRSLPTCLAASLGSVRWKKTKKAKTAIIAPKKVELLIDGDSSGPTTWEPAQAALRQTMGFTTVSSKVFGAQQHLENPKLKVAMHSANVEPIFVHKKTGGTKDQNDIAIGLEAGRLAEKGDVHTVALLAIDADFVYLARRLRSLGKSFVAILREGAGVGIAKQFEAEGAKVLFIRSADGKRAKQAKMKMILQRGDEHAILPITGSDALTDVQTHPELAEIMHRLQYIESVDDPLLPAVAKFYRANNLANLVVFPGQLGLHQADLLMSKSKPDKYRNNPGNLAFVLPIHGSDVSSKSQVEKYGSGNCARVMIGGGAFLLQSSADLAYEFLRRLRYLDREYNADVSEAIDVFASRQVNRRALRLLRLRIAPFFDVESKKALLHTALMTTAYDGTWATAPTDAGVREYLFSQSLIRGIDVPRRKVFDALRSYAIRQSLPQFKNYNSLVQSCQQHVKGGDPNMRRLTI